MAGLDDLLVPQDNAIPGADFTFLDADTVETSDGTRVRLRGVNAPETADLWAGKTGEVGGSMTTEQVMDLANKMGYTNVVYNPEDIDDTGTRAVGDLQDKHGRSFARALASQGILQVSDKHDTLGLRESAEFGAFLRTDKDRELTDWDKARDMISSAIKDDQQYANQFRTQQLIAGDLRSDKYDRMASGSAAFEYSDRDTDTGKSLNPLSDAWDTGLIGVQESMYGVVDMLGETTGYDALSNIGEAGITRARSKIADRGHFITDYRDVDGFWDAVEYISNNAAMSLPYMAISAGGAVAAPFTGGVSLAAPAAVYSGQTWNEMEGEKNAAVAVGAGVAQAALDRLGLGLIFKGAGKAPKEMLKAGVNKLVADGMTKEAATATVMAATRKELAGFAGDAAQVAAQQLKSKAIFKNIAGRAATGALGEGATEALQESVGYIGATLGSDKQFDWNELAERQMQAIVAGAALGGAFSVPTGVYDVGAWADIAVREAGADASKLSNAGRYAEEEKANFGRVSSIQENTASLAERAKAAPPNAHPSLEERTENDKRRRKDRTGGEKLADTLMSAPALWRGATRFIFDTATLDKSRSARIAADMFGGQLQRTFSGSNYENQKHHIATIYRNLVPDPKSYWASLGLANRAGFVNRKVAGTESKKMYDAFNAAIDPKSKDLNMDAVPDKYKPMVKQMLALGDKMWKDQQKYNPELGYQKNYLLRYKSFNKDNIKKNKGQFADLLVKNFNMPRSDAIDLATQITESAEVNDFNDILTGTGAAGKPGAHKERTLNLSEHADFQAFMEQDIFTNIANAAKGAARYQAHSEFVGENNAVINQLLADMEAEGVAPEKVDRIASQMQDYLAAESGNYKRATSEAGKKLETVQRSLMTWMAAAGLPLATISSFVEIALTTKGLTKEQIFGKNGLKVNGEKIAKDMWETMGKASEFDQTQEGETSAVIKEQHILDRLGYSTWDVGSANSTSTAQKVGATEISASASRFMDTYFKVTGLTQWTNYTRMVRAGFAGDWLKAKIELIATSDPDNKTNAVQEAEEQMRNYGLDVDKTVQDYLTGTPMDDAALREFQFNWINDAVVHPQSANRPLLYQDPRFALFTQFQGFISAFTANQIPKLWGEYVKRGTPAMKYNAFAVMATMILMGFVSQYLKDLIKYMDAGNNPYLDRPEYIQRGIRASGLLGTGERVLDQFFPIYETRHKGTGDWIFQTTTGEAPALSFAKRALGGVGKLVTGDVGGAAKEAVRVTPFGPLTFLRDAAGETASSWNFKGE